MAFAPLALDRPRRRARIGLTPLIDIVFILLMFFMLSSSFVDRHVMDIATPAVVVGAPQPSDALLVELDESGVRFNGEPIALNRLAARMSPYMAASPGRPVTVRVEAGVALGPMVSVLDALTSAGAANVSLQKAGAT